ncbi:MAG: T9SS type A sorting domain-containing protein, partial [Bacteroidota bacterium]
TGGNTGDRVGSSGIKVLSNGNFVISSPQWNNGNNDNAGAVTWGNATTGVSGVVSSSNSLVGSTANDRVGLVFVLPNGNYLIRSVFWDSGAVSDVGAVTWGNGATGTNGVISSSNSLVGSSASDELGSRSIIILSNSNYIVVTSNWDNGSISNVGAVTWGNGSVGTSGVVSSSNSLIGSAVNDEIGFGGITELANGNYVVNSFRWDNNGVQNAGAVTWGDGTSGVSGVVSSSNSLVGSSAFDQVGSIIALTNGNYVISTPGWNNGSTGDVGAVTWADGTMGLSGIVSSSNSLIGSTAGDFIEAKALNNGNYLLTSSRWDNEGITDAGIVTWVNGIVGASGVVSSSNSLVGSTAADRVGSGGITVLTNGNYVVSSPAWDNGSTPDVGAVTWGDGMSGRSGVISSSNSLIGSTTADQVGSNGITGLINGNYVVSSSNWDDGTASNTGAVTWCNGSSGTTGVVSSNNSLVGDSNSDQVGSDGIFALTNGNYVVRSLNWDDGTISNAGAVTWGDGSSGTTGVVSSSNSLVGSSSNDELAGDGIKVLSNGNYVVISPFWDNGNKLNAGAVTWGNGSSGTMGFVSSNNSLVGGSSFNQVGFDGVTVLKNGNYVVNSSRWVNSSALSAGAVTFVDGTTGLIGAVSGDNSLIGSSNYDLVGFNSTTALANGAYIIKNTSWNNGTLTNSGAVTLGNALTGISGQINSCNSVLGNIDGGGSKMSATYNEVYDKLIVGTTEENIINIFSPRAVTLAINSDKDTISMKAFNNGEFVSETCQIIAGISSRGANAVRDEIKAAVWIESSQPSNYVKRHYEIAPTNDFSTATGKVTLYFTQSEFDDFNTVAPIALPTSPNDAVGISNLLIEKMASVSSDNSGDLNSYTESGGTIDPDDTDIVWNDTQLRWEISFDVAGFGGFFLKTQSNLLLQKFICEGDFLDVIEEIGNTQSLNAQKRLIATNTITSIGDATYTAGDSIVFKAGFHAIGSLHAFIAPCQFNNINPIEQRTTDHNNVQLDLSIYPNPLKDIAHIRFDAPQHKDAQINIYSITGQFIQQLQIPSTGEMNINLSHLNAGLYWLSLQTREEVLTKKFLIAK